MDTKELAPDVEDQVIALPVSERFVDTDTKLDGGVNDGRLRYSAFLIGREHDRKDSLRIGQR